jgi:integrase
LKGGSYIEPRRTSLAEFLDHWLEQMKGQVTPRSHERYSELVRKNIVPLIGGALLGKLHPTTIARAYTKALESGRRNGMGGLSPATVKYMHRVLRQALQQAVRWDLLSRNPADAVRPPKAERKELNVLDADAAAGLIEAARGSTLFIPILLGIGCGLRRGEIAALRWRSIDLARSQISVVASAEQTRDAVREKSPKSGIGRAVTLPTLVARELRQHRTRQAEAFLRLGVRLSDEHHVVTRVDGQPLQPRSITHGFAMLLRKHGLARLRFHDLRHSHATQLLASGVHPKAAQERLGHASVAITLDLYSHVVPGLQAEAADRVDHVLQDAINRHRKEKGSKTVAND